MSSRAVRPRATPQRGSLALQTSADLKGPAIAGRRGHPGVGHWRMLSRAVSLGPEWPCHSPRRLDVGSPLPQASW
eukprot:scaffold324_cov394-Prasinococcus_capsulatus_cf.AAC.8